MRAFFAKKGGNVSDFSENVANVLRIGFTIQFKKKIFSI